MNYRVLLMVFSIFLWSSFVVSSDNPRAVYENELFGFRVEESPDWKLYGEEKYNRKLGRAIVDYGLPLVWSELEQQHIENAVSIRAYIRPDIRNLDQMVAFEKRRISDILVSIEEVPSVEGKAFITVTKIKGLEYKSKSTILYLNDCGYVVAFTATHGTFDQNMEKYRNFIDRITFFQPKLRIAYFRKTEQNE